MSVVLFNVPFNLNTKYSEFWNSTFWVFSAFWAFHTFCGVIWQHMKHRNTVGKKKIYEVYMRLEKVMVKYSVQIMSMYWLNVVTK